MEQTQLDAQPISIPLTFFPTVEPILFNLPSWPVKKKEKLDFPESLAVAVV